MLILVSGATKTLMKLKGHPHLGQLVTPQDGNKIIEGMPFAADNAAYSNWDEQKFINLLDRLQGTAPLWVASPDVVGNAKATDELFDKWRVEIVEKRKLPIALVLQNGQESIGLPASFRYNAVFIGGDNEFKLGKYVRNYCIPRAKEYGKWVHMGRVNSWRRLQYAYEIGCDSVDGTGFSRFPDTYILRYIRYLEKPQMHMDLEFARETL
jgi:hypothetical protein